MVPKGFRNNININPSHIGPVRRQEILNDIADNSGFLPRGVSEEDMDETFVEYVKNDLAITINGQKIPVLFLTIQRWSEFSKTWQNSDKYGNISLPFITVVRRPDIQVGTNQAGNWNIPGQQTYTFMKVPTWDGTRKGVDLYKIPQPVSVDLTYDVRIFTNRMRDLNKFNTLIHKKYQSRQSYIYVKGHPMPTTLEGISDESNIEDFNQRRFYVQEFEIKLMGYLVNEDDFEVVPTINRVYTMIELDENKPFHSVIFDAFIKNNTLAYTIVFKPRAVTQFAFTAKYDLLFTDLINVENLQGIIINVNGTLVSSGLTLSSPIQINAGDLIDISVSKRVLQMGKFELIGNTL